MLTYYALHGWIFFPTQVDVLGKKADKKKILIDIISVGAEETAGLLGCAYFVDVENY